MKKKPSSEASVCRPPSAVIYLPSFTMLELITVLTISTIVIGMAYVAYELIYKDFLDYKTQTTDTLATMDFITILERDINISDSLQTDTYNFKIYQKNHTIQYDFYEENTVRYLLEKEYIVDTFQVKMRNFTLENQHLFFEYALDCLACENSEKIYMSSLRL